MQVQFITLPLKHAQNGRLVPMIHSGAQRRLVNDTGADAICDFMANWLGFKSNQQAQLAGVHIVPVRTTQCCPQQTRILSLDCCVSHIIWH